MPRSLVSREVRVAKSGDTIDGRLISKQEIIDMATTYDRDVYTANIYPEHQRGMGVLGTVYSASYKEEDDGELGLYARVRPNDEFIYLNDKSQKLFPSVEITPNFANKGFSYLSGMGAVDEPSSLGCQEFYFSKRAKLSPQTKLVVHDTPFPKDLQLQPEKQSLLAMIKSFCKSMTHTSNHLKQFAEENPTMTPEEKAALIALYEAQVAVTNGFADFINSLEGETPPPNKEQQDAVTQTEDAVAQIVEVAKESAEFNKQLVGQMAAMTEAFNKMASNTAAPRQFNTVKPVANQTAAGKSEERL